MPSEKWKIRTQRQKWYAGETPSVAIGQGALTVTPIQLARAIGGVGRRRRVASSAPGQESGEEAACRITGPFRPDNVKRVIDGMYARGQ